MRAHEIHDQVPGLSFGRAADQFEPVACNPVVAIVLIAQGRRGGITPPEFLASLPAPAKVRRANPALRRIDGIQIGVIGVFRPLGIRLVGSHSVAFAGVVDQVGKAPSLHVAAAADSPRIRSLREVELAAAHHVIAAVAQQKIVGRLIERVVLLVPDHAAMLILPSRGQAGARWRAKRRSDNGNS